MKPIGGFILLAIRMFFLADTVYYAAKYVPLGVFGRLTKAEVVELWVEQLNQLDGREDGELQFSFNLKYQFATLNGEIITGTAKTSALEWSRMWEGLNIDFLNFPLYPELNHLNDSYWAWFLSCSYLHLSSSVL